MLRGSVLAAARTGVGVATGRAWWSSRLPERRCRSPRRQGVPAGVAPGRRAYGPAWPARLSSWLLAMCPSSAPPAYAREVRDLAVLVHEVDLVGVEHHAAALRLRRLSPCWLSLLCGLGRAFDSHPHELRRGGSGGRSRTSHGVPVAIARRMCAPACGSSSAPVAHGHAGTRRVRPDLAIAPPTEAEPVGRRDRRRDREGWNRWRACPAVTDGFCDVAEMAGSSSVHASLSGSLFERRRPSPSPSRCGRWLAR